MLVCFGIILSSTKLKSFRLRESPCLIPVVVSIGSVNLLLVHIRVFVFVLFLYDFRDFLWDVVFCEYG